MGHFDMGPIWKPPGEPDDFFIYKELIFLLNFYKYIPNEIHKYYFNEILKFMK